MGVSQAEALEIVDRAEVRAYGIGKKRLDGHVDRLWVLPTGVICAGDDVNVLGEALAQAKLFDMLQKESPNGRNDRRHRSGVTKEGPAKKRVTSKRTAEEVEEKQESLDPDKQDPEFVSARPDEMDTAAVNSAPHPELWPSPDSVEDDDQEEDPAIEVVPAEPNTNLEFTIKATGLPRNSGLVFKLEGMDATGTETFLTHKSDPQGVAHVVWRSQVPGKVEVSILTKNDNELGSALVSHTFEIIDPAEDRRLGEERGAA